MRTGRGAYNGCMPKTQLSPLTPKVVLGVGAHPDDMDFYAGGAMAKWAQQGAEVYYLVLTDGGKGSEDRTVTPEMLREQRRREQRQAGKKLGLKDIFFCDYPDGALENTMAVKRDIVKVIRRLKPEVVVTFDPVVLYFADWGLINHPDHRAAGQATLDAVYPLARNHLSFPELLADYEPYSVPTLLLITFDPENSNFAVDITNTFESKLRALEAHASQTSLHPLKESLQERAAAAGQAYGYTYAESFMRIDVS